MSLSYTYYLSGKYMRHKGSAINKKYAILHSVSIGNLDVEPEIKKPHFWGEGGLESRCLSESPDSTLLFSLN